MKRLFKAARVAAIGTGLLAASATPPQPLAAQEPEGESATSLLWKIEDDDNTVYLLGSIHLLTADVYPLKPAIESAFADAERVVFEVPMDSVARRAPEMIALGTFRDGRSLESVLEPETYEMVGSALEEYGLSPRQFAVFEPWLLALTLSTIEWQRAGLRPEYGLDAYFTRKATEEGKTLGALEKAEFQLHLFDGMDAADQDAFLRSTLEQLDETSEMMAEVTAAWQAGDAERIDELVNAPLSRYPSIYSTLLTDRNENWVPHVEALIDGSEDALVVVGAAHLVGHDGLVELLRRRGHTAEQL